MSASIPGQLHLLHQLGYQNVGIGIVLSVWAIGMIVASNTIPQRVLRGAVADGDAAAQPRYEGLAKFIAPF